jgi:hypothetical protein
MPSSLQTACLLLAVLCMPACSSLERSSDLAQHQLATSQSTKKDVVNSIGLPRSIEKYGDGEVEYWYYTGKPISTSYFVPIPTSSTPYSPGLNMVHYADLGSKNVIGGQPVVLICVFNRAGQLVHFYKPEQK